MSAPNAAGSRRSAVVGAFSAVVWLESRRPLRRRRESQAIRTARNVAIAGVTAAITTAGVAPHAAGGAGPA
jgi:hypothetical protein